MNQPISIAENRDCMEAMKEFPDKFFDLAIVDPPYGIGMDGQKEFVSKKNRKHNRKAHERKSWDFQLPDERYFTELFRVSRNQIIWGGNYMTYFLPPTKAWIFWYKGQRDLTMSDGEMAWTSFASVTRQIELNRVELLKQNTIHPTEKPFRLYQWLLKNYAKPNNKILDTHLGSGSSRIAAYKMGYDFWSYEVDKDYFEAQEKRFKDAIAEPLFESVKLEQGKLI